MGNIMLFVSELMIPLIVVGVILCGILSKISAYDVFVEGAKKGITTVLQILPTLIGLMVAVGVLRTSGFLEGCSRVLEGVLGGVGFPTELVPLSLVKLVSSSAGTGLLLDIYTEYGVDSSLGIMASIMMSSTETVFYTMSIYYMTAKVRKTRWTLKGALLATAGGTIASIWLGGMMSI